MRISAVFFMSGPLVPGGGGCVVAYGRDACGCAVDCGAGSIGTGLRVEAEVGVCTENLSSGVVVVKSAKDGV